MEEFIKVTVDIEDTQPLPDDEALRLLASTMIGKQVKTPPGGAEGDICGIVTKADVVDGKIVITARIDDPDMIGRMKKGTN